MNTTDKKIQLATATFQSGYNCAQSVLATFAFDFGMDRDTLLKMATPFGSGIAKTQQTCGAVTGALLAIGLKYGKGSNGTDNDKNFSYQLAQQLMAQFKEEHGCTNCLALMDNLDMNNPSDIAQIKARDLHNTYCVKYIQTAIKLTDEILQQK
ncbi:MAG: GCAxxG family protein [Bacteroidetes bacterium]|jgi:C_GCAxxG_C_C family probable redox protein|nr:GCAxxG family protein [Bacteroidota bacterium]